MNYEEAHSAFFIDKSLKHDWALVKAFYPEGEIPCDGLVVTEKDAINAVNYYLCFYHKLVFQDTVNDKVKSCFQETINKYLGMVLEKS